VTFDGRGNGHSERPRQTEAYADAAFVADALSVMDATNTARAELIALSKGATWALLLAAEHPERVSSAAFIASAAPLAPGHPQRVTYSVDQPLDTDRGWAKFNYPYWRKNYADFLQFFFAQAANEPHSTKLIEDAVGWGLDTDAETLIAASAGPGITAEEACALAKRVRCPVLVLHGDNDAISPRARGVALAEATGGTMVTLEGSGHLPHGRDPVKVNLLLHEFLGRVDPPRSTWRRAMTRKRKRALFVSSPIGLGHAQRDVAVADALRRIVPDLEIDWLAQDPVTRVLEAHGERVHPLSTRLAGESQHVESECGGEHDLHVFQAWRRMDEILLANFMVFYDTVKDGQYDLWLADEGWDIDYYLHENPELKTAPYVWLTDFVGWLPMHADEGWLTADYNAEMIEQIARFPRVRDRAIFVGNPPDIVPDTFGADLPGIRDWVTAHYSFPGYIQYFDARQHADRAAGRERLQFRDDEQVVFAAVGGTAVGRSLLERIIHSFPIVKRRVPNLRMIVVAGPRIDPASLPQTDGLEYRGYVHNLYEQFAACDLALVQGGLSTTMELVATGRPFLYFPLQNHFEQTFHVPHRLANYGVGPSARVDFADATPERLAERIVQALGCSPVYQPVEADGAELAAKSIAELL
jgi:pimeloyl-ACP methyl ester carboxylesterase/predicted glycosyltransferase